MEKRCFKSFFRVFFAVLCAATLAFSTPGASGISSSVLPVENSAPRHYEVSVRLDVPLVLGIALTSALGVYQYYGMERISADDLRAKSDFCLGTGLLWGVTASGRRL